MSRQSGKASLKDNNSPATSYLLSVLEKRVKEDTFRSPESTLSRVSSAFASLDEILPHCGIYTPVLKLIKEELIDAVYSDTYTTSSSSDGRNSTQLERVPYFALLQRLHEQRSESTELMEGKINKVKQENEKIMKEIRDKDVSIAELQALVESLKQNEVELNEVILSKEAELDDINSKVKDIKVHADDKTQAYEEVLKELKQIIGNLRGESGNLRKYKVAYDTLKDTFDLPADKRPRRGFRRPVVSTKKTQLLSSIEAASKLEQQIIEVQTKCLEEYDQYLEEVKETLSAKKFADNESDAEFFNEELQLETLGDEMTARLRNFQRLISGSVVELELVRQHRDSLQSQLSQMEQAENMAAGDAGSNAGTLPPSSMAGGPGSSRMMTHDQIGKKTSTESQFSIESGLEEDTTPLVDPTSDPFNPQERLLSKYSAMIYTSVNSGKTFDEISFAQFCQSCGEKTAVCPHKITKNDMVVPLPRNCTHIKLARPMVRLSMPAISQHGVHDHEAYGQHVHGKWYDTIHEGQHWNNLDTYDVISTRSLLTPLWEDAKRLAGIETNASTSSVCSARDLSLHRVLSLLEQFYASVVWRDEKSTADDEVSTIREHLYNFMSERYQEDEISPVATYDLITAIVKHAAHDKSVLVLGLTLAGVLDGSVARYVHLIADFVESVDWKNVHDFEAFASCLYPFMHEDDLEQFVMEFTAHSENKISKTLVLNYIIHIITKNKEPRMLDAEAKLSGLGMKEKGQMTTQEFLNAMETISPLANEQLVIRLVHECMLTIGYSVAPVKRLASIAAYITLLQICTLLKEHICERVEKARQKEREVVTKLSSSKSLVPETGKIITMTEIKKLAFNIARQRQAGNRQSQVPYEDDMYWNSRPNTRDSLF
nr:uncharacterized protein LOC100177030 [Ciona intestinalis]|eukprot:XP_002121447.1 uncharacterized protein LOC100177030 [Ciona intestinalis]